MRIRSSYIDITLEVLPQINDLPAEKYLVAL